MEDKKLTPHEWKQKNYDEHRAYIVLQRDLEGGTDASSFERREWQRLLMDLDAAHDRLMQVR